MSDLVGEVVGSAINDPVARWNPADMADHELSLELLVGYQGDTGVEFPEKGGPREQILRAALARELRRHMRSLVGDFLAMAVDPRAVPLTPTRRRTRHIVFESPTPGKASTWARDAMMIDYLRRLLRNGVKDTAAYQLTAEKYGCSVRTVRDVWGAYQALGWYDQHVIDWRQARGLEDCG
jgi:hypothetical protein